MWHSRAEALTETMLRVPFLKFPCTKCETLLVSFLYTTLPTLKPKTQPHAAECFLRIRVTQTVKKCTSFHTDREFIIVCTTVRHRTTLRLIEPVTRNSHLVLCLRTGLVPSDFETSVKRTSPVCYVFRSSGPPWFGHPNNIRRRVRTMTLFIIAFLPLPFEAPTLSLVSFLEYTLYLCTQFCEHLTLSPHCGVFLLG